MLKCPRFGAVCLLLMLQLLAIGCGREGRLPTATAARDHLEPATPSLRALGENTAETFRVRGHRHVSPPAAIAEAKAGLGGVLTGEQVYRQRWGTFTDVPDTADFRIALGVYFGDLLQRWRFSVSGASVAGFLATAEGRNDTGAEGITVTLGYRSEQPVVWEVQRRKPHDHPRAPLRKEQATGGDSTPASRN